MEHECDKKFFEISNKALIKLEILEAAGKLDDLRIPLQINSRNCLEIEQINTVYELMINGECALPGTIQMLMR